MVFFVETKLDDATEFVEYMDKLPTSVSQQTKCLYSLLQPSELKIGDVGSCALAALATAHNKGTELANVIGRAISNPDGLDLSGDIPWLEDLHGICVAVDEPGEAGFCTAVRDYARIRALEQMTDTDEDGLAMTDLIKQGNMLDAMTLGDETSPSQD